MAKKIKVKVKSRVQTTNKKQPDPMEIPLEAKATPTAVKQSTGLKTPNLTVRARFTTKKA